MVDKKQIKELEDLAEKFIIGYKPLNDKQKKLLDIGWKLQMELNILRKKEKRIIKLMDKLNELMVKTTQKVD